jgi:GNAT superfamily N-acetyltransferase
VPDICRWLDLPDPAAARPAIERIFFAASGTQTFANDTIRAAFRERWLDRYLDGERRQVWVALHDGAIIGYLAGSLQDPARSGRFADLAYYETFAPLTERYPAHLHINLDAAARSHGTGSRLVEVFCGDVQDAGLPGAHLVTGKGARNVAFYERLGFLERGVALSNGREVVLLGRDL